MNLVEFLKDKIVFLFINIFLFIVVSMMMFSVKVNSLIVILVFCIWFMPLITYILMEYISKKVFYNEIQSILGNLEKKYLLPEVIKEPSFMEGKVIYEIIKELSKDMHENVKLYRDMQIEYREYIEMWVHEIKTPIASTKLIIENNKNEVTERINLQINRVEDFIEQVLFYARSSDVSKDYIIKRIELSAVINSVIRRNSRDFISKKIKLDIGNINNVIYSDVKWVEYILNQVVGNSIKYCKNKNAVISIYTVEKENSVILTIIDNGVGIIERDINRIFEKGFTGENGRKFGKATGMGLYLSKNLCEKLGLGMDIESRLDEGTKVNIIFPLNKLTGLNK
ncbi:MAG: sensor histidine kinase [Clostridium sp.]|uniref:sensor histidine kinase n=1 Tax=Clostridium sp. TaxID=1506 RepID=UPI0030586982